VRRENTGEPTTQQPGLSTQDSALHYRHPPAHAFRLNKLLHRVYTDASIRKAFASDPEAVSAEYGLNAEQAEAAKALDVPRLSALGAHPLLAFMARFTVEHDRRSSSPPA